MQEPVESTNNMKQKNKEVKTVEPRKIMLIWQNEGKLLRLLSDQRLNHRKTSCKQELWGKMETSCSGHTVNDMVKTGRFLFHGSSKVWISSPNWLSLMWSYLLISGVLQNDEFYGSNNKSWDMTSFYLFIYFPRINLIIHG